jgi:hypothetical protein
MAEAIGAQKLLKTLIGYFPKKLETLCSIQLTTLHDGYESPNAESEPDAIH